MVLRNSAEPDCSNTPPENIDQNELSLSFYPTRTTQKGKKPREMERVRSKLKYAGLKSNLLSHRCYEVKGASFLFAI